MPFMKMHVNTLLYTRSLWWVEWMWQLRLWSYWLEWPCIRLNGNLYNFSWHWNFMCGLLFDLLLSLLMKYFEIRWTSIEFFYEWRRNHLNFAEWTFLKFKPNNSRYTRFIKTRISCLKLKNIAISHCISSLEKKKIKK